MDYQTLLVERTGHRAEVTVNRPQALNALNARVIEELTHFFDTVAADGQVRVVIVKGAGEKAFVAGADIAGMVDLEPAQAQAFSELGHRLGDAIARSPVIAIAAVQGFALGGGCELALACDMIFAADNAKFGQPEVKLGVIPGFGGTQRLVRRVGLGKAIELTTVADPIDAAEALRIGLANAVFPKAELLDKVRAMADKIADRGPFAVAAAKHACRQAHELPLAEGNRLEARTFGSCFATADQKEGMKAFLEKRPAKFTGR